MQQRQRTKQTVSLNDRLDSFAKDALKKASQLPPGSEREEMLRKARQAVVASNIDQWAYSAGLQPPK